MLRRLLAFSVVSGLFWFPGCSGDEDGNGGDFEIGAKPAISVTPYPVQFPTLAVGETHTIEVMILNKAEANGTLSLFDVQLQGSKDFSITQPAVKVMAPGDPATKMTVTYTPKDTEVDAGNLVFTWAKGSIAFVVPITTVQQVGVLTLLPSPVQFGNVASGQPRVIGVRALNQGSSDLEIGNMSIGGDSTDFKNIGVYELIADACPGFAQGTLLVSPFIAKAGSGFCIDVQYNPFLGGTDTGVLEVNPKYDAANPDQAPIATATLQGAEIGPEITILDAPKVDFGSLTIGESKELTFRINNSGNADLIVASVVKDASEFEIFGDVTLVTEVAADTAVAPKPENDIVVTVKFEPTTSYPVTYGAIGFIKVKSNDFDEPEVFITVTAQTAEGKLQVTPAEIIDFGIVAEGPSGSKRFITFTNVGSAPLSVSNVAIGQNTPASEYSIATPPESPMTIEAGDYRTVDLKFVNSGGPEGEVMEGVLSFASSDAAGPTMVNLRATRAKKAFCKLKLEPATVNFGTIGFGFEKTMTLNITNVGSAPCSPFSVNVFDGSIPFAFPGTPPGPATCQVLATDDSTQFTVINEPPAIKDLLQPGQTLPLQIKYVPEGNLFSGAFSPDELSQFAGLVQVTMLDYSTPDAVTGNAWTVRTEPPGDIGATVPCNLKGKAGAANIAAIPGEIAFDLTTVGCFSKTEDVKVYNTGKADIQVCAVKLEGCGPEFKLKNVPPIPPCNADGTGGYTLSPGNPMLLGVVYGPQDTNPDGCSIVVNSNDVDTPGLYIPLTGEGTFDTEQTDEYTQLSGQQVDVLFIVDNSGSMSEEQGSLGSNISSFTNEAAQWQTSYQIGVVSTDVDTTNKEAGWLQTDGGGQPRFFTNATGVGGFDDTVKALGTGGSGSEAGLQAAKMALSFPVSAKLANPPKVCTTNTDCVAPSVCVPSVLQTNKKYCSGWNMEFLREDAVLELVFVSDEEDQSSGDLGFYIDFFKNIKGFANTNLFHAHSIVGPSGGCSSGAGDAAAGERYLDFSAATNGKTKSICDGNWAQILKDIGTIAFGLKVQFFLSRPPIPDTIEVKVKGKVCNVGQGWEYQEDSNAVLFDEAGPCMPQENDTITIHYEVICYGE